MTAARTLAGSEPADWNLFVQFPWGLGKKNTGRTGGELFPAEKIKGRIDLKPVPNDPGCQAHRQRSGQYSLFLKVGLLQLKNRQQPALS